MSDSLTIIIAWVAMDGSRLTGRYVDRYLYQPELETCPQTHSLCWLRAGTREDVAKAVEHCLQEITTGAGLSIVPTMAGVYAYPTGHPDPFKDAETRCAAGDLGEVPAACAECGACSTSVRVFPTGGEARPLCVTCSWKPAADPALRQCSRCGALPGRPCVTARGAESKMHKARSR